MVNNYRRRAFTITEAIISLTVITAVGALVAEHAAWTISERNRSDAKLEAVEVATNILEQARDKPWNELNAAWAKARVLPKPIANRWPHCRLQVRVEPEPKMPNIKRVTVEVKWENTERSSWQPVILTSFFATRSTEAKP
jgi:type II secretory pathway pseudopilin PulG